LDSPLKDRARHLLDPAVTFLARLGIRPTAVTVCGLVLSVVSGGLIAGGRLRAAAGWLILAALCDVLDGQLARRTGRASAFGAFLDSCLDRVGEGAVFTGLVLYLGPRGAPWVALAVIALIASTMVSYARARAEGLGLDGKAGVLERPERLVLLILALLLGGRALLVILGVIAVFASFTFLARVRHVARQVAMTESVKEMKVDG
jgi:CDP-diacylglycerol---glycerol-3-phosphate 3-phosphatidyltransferase